MSLQDFGTNIIEQNEMVAQMRLRSKTGTFAEDRLNDESSTCTRAEREVLDMIKFWPEITAIVTYSSERGWSGGTDPRDVDCRAKAQE